MCKKLKSQPKVKPPPKTLKDVYDGPIIATEEGRDYTCHLKVVYCVEERTLNITIGNQREGRKSSIGLSLSIEVPEERLKIIGEDLSWLSISKRKIVVIEKQLDKLIAGEPKTSRRSFWPVDKKQIFTEAKLPGNIEGVLSAFSSDEYE